MCDPCLQLAPSSLGWVGAFWSKPHLQQGSCVDCSTVPLHMQCLSTWRGSFAVDFPRSVPQRPPFSASRGYHDRLPANILHRDGKLNPRYLCDWLSQRL